ncbi:P-loop NTPase fold protein, partial [Pseudomonas sp. PA-5-4A]
MSRISFQNEHPSDQDVFPGGSHEKVATAICDYITDEKNSRVIGLDGEFGSGKSSILKMLEQKLIKSNSKYKVWFFDCEQNYQGSIKSNFIELFTDELISHAVTDKQSIKILQDNRDKALGRHFSYTKSTTSKVSGWALLLIVALFFSASSFKELFALTKLDRTVGTWIYVLHSASLISPLITLIIAWFSLRGTKIGDQPWSVFHLFKGGSDDTITEKIQVAKEVTPLDLKRTLESDLKQLKDIHYIVILDNLDRLPKDSLRSVWSDLEIFTWASEENNLTTIVPFCSNKVAKYLGADKDRTYDSKDFIAKKFPVVFRSPPIIAAGWKDGFYKLWKNTYAESSRDIAEKCALLLQRHSPMAGKLVTPRLQKRFINDIATTSLILGPEISLISIGAHLLLCKYNDHPLEEILRSDGFSELYKDKNEHIDDKEVAATKHILETVVGSSIESGWQIQFLQIHFLTTSNIAIAELIDVPLMASIEEQDLKRFASLVTVFGFRDALKRLLAKGGYTANLVKIISDSAELLEKEDTQLVISTINGELNTFIGDTGDDTGAFYKALKNCRTAGLSTDGFKNLTKILASPIQEAVNESVEADRLSEHVSKLREYDHYIDALNIDIDTIIADNAAYLLHVVFPTSDLKVIKPDHFSFSEKGNANVFKHFSSSSESHQSLLAISEDQREFLLKFIYSTKKTGSPTIAQFTKTGIAGLQKTILNNPINDGALFGLALLPSVDETVLSFLANQPFSGRTPNQNAAIATIFLKAKKYEILSEVENLDAVVDSAVFKLFFRSGIRADTLISGFEIENIKNIIFKIFAWAVKNDTIFRVAHTDITKNFSKIVKGLEAHEVDGQQLFLWLNDWERHMSISFETAEALDLEFVKKIPSSSKQQYPAIKNSSYLYYGSQERTELEWTAIITSSSQNHTIFLNLLKTLDEFKVSPAARIAIANVLKTKLVDTADFSISDRSIQNIEALTNILDQGQKNLLGTEIRNLIYSENSVNRNIAEALQIFGGLIVDIQPSSTLEVGKLLGILEYLSEDSAKSLHVLNFLDSRAAQIAAYNYSQELLMAMAFAVVKLRERAPKLYQTFAKKKQFKTLIKEAT